MQTVREVLRDLPSGNLVEIEDGGYTVGMVYIDSEDLATYSLPEDMLELEVKSVLKNCQFRFNRGEKVIDGVYIINI